MNRLILSVYQDILTRKLGKSFGTPVMAYFNGSGGTPSCKYQETLVCLHDVSFYYNESNKVTNLNNLHGIMYEHFGESLKTYYGRVIPDE